jgi:hypothetical protein|nr:hypothetical protein [uncultured Acetatifactor sp.]
MDNTEFSKGKEYLLLIHHIENGVVDVEWHDNIESAKESVNEAWSIAGYEIFHVKDASLIESSLK